MQNVLKQNRLYAQVVQSPALIIFRFSINLNAPVVL